MDTEDAEIITLNHMELDQGSLKDASLVPVFLYFQKTQREFIKTRPKRGGGQVKYVPIWYVKQILNYATKFRWSSYIDGSTKEGDFIIVWGRVVIEIEGKEYTQSAFGRNEIKYYKGTKNPVDIGDAYKSAQADMIKKAVNNWGVAMDVYTGREED